jgi:hypothetical protein
MVRGWWVLIAVVISGCIGIRTPAPPDTSLLPVPEADGTVNATFYEFILEEPVLYDVSFPNIGGEFINADDRLLGNGLVVEPVMHFKTEEALSPYIKRFFNVDVPPFEAVPDTGLTRSDNGEKFYVARPMTVEGQEGWLVVQFTADGNTRMVRYGDWFVALVAGAEVTRVEG